MQTAIPVITQEIHSQPSVDAMRIVLALAAPIDSYFRRACRDHSAWLADSQWLDGSEMDSKRWERTLQELQPEVLVTGWGTPQLPESFYTSTDCALRYVCHLAGGVKWLVPRPVIEQGVLVSNWGHSISYTVAEHAVLLVLGLLRNLPEWSDLMRGWPARSKEKPMRILPTRSLRHKRVGIHGFGAVAREIASMLRPFGPEIMAYSEGVPLSLFHDAQVRPASSLEELFSKNEVIIECEALTPKTRGAISASLLRLLPQDAIFVNVGRGPIVDEKALIELATAGRIKVGMDVYQQEPISADYPLFQLPNTLLTPHMAGPTEDAFTDLCAFAIRNINRYFKQEPLEGLVSLDVYDRSS